MTALAVAYQVQCRLSDVAPVRAKDLITRPRVPTQSPPGSRRLSVWIGPKRPMRLLSAGRPLTPCGFHRTGALSNWKGSGLPQYCLCCTHGTFLAMRGITGPMEIFEGNKGFMDVIAGPIQDRLVERGSRTSHSDDSQEIQR